LHPKFEMPFFSPDFTHPENELNSKPDLEPEFINSTHPESESASELEFEPELVDLLRKG